MREGEIRIGERRTRYLEAGSGRPLVLLHAFPLRAEMWAPQLEHPPAGWRVIAPDLHGFGGTSFTDPGRPSTVGDLAAGVEELLDQLHVDRAVIGGQSMGGYVTFALVRRAPSRWTGIVLADTRAGADTPEGRERRRSMLDLVHSRGAAGVADLMLPTLLAELTVRERPELAVRVRQMIESTAVPAIAAAIEAMMSRPDSTADLDRLAVPALVLVGDLDTVTPPAESEAMHRRIAGSRLAVLPRAGHLSNLEAPEAFSEALASFLASVRA